MLPAGGAQAHRRGQQQQGDRLGPAGRIVDDVAREHLPALYHHQPQKGSDGTVDGDVGDAVQQSLCGPGGGRQGQIGRAPV
ncbi:hypothetical protein G6F24_018846 [Rhizopus arrhizus]|nr:hypothetical protein G6F24_018846 [Rhizopus arrhizus]